MKMINLELSDRLYKKLSISSKRRYLEIGQEILFCIEQELSAESDDNMKTINVVIERKGMDDHDNMDVGFDRRLIDFKKGNPS